MGAVEENLGALPHGLHGCVLCPTAPMVEKIFALLHGRIPAIGRGRAR